MQKWEYAELEVTLGGANSGSKGVVHMYRSDGNHESKNDKPGILFAQLGEQGWELTTMQGLTGTRFIYIFKRPIPE